MTITESSMSAAAASWPAEPSLDFLLDEGLGDAYLQDPFNKRTNSGPPPSSVRVDPEEGAELDPFAWSVTSSADPASQSADVSASGSASEGALRCVGAIAANQRSAAQQIAATSFAGLSNAAQRPADQTDAAAIGSSGRAPRRRSADTQRAAKGTPQHRLDDAEARAAEVERQIEALRLSNAKLDTRNALLEKYLKLTEEPDERGIWWLDERVRRQMEASLDMDPQHLTFTVYQARPLRLTRAEVGAMTFHGYQKLWKAYVDVFAGILLTDETVGHANDGSPAGRRLGQLCLESGRLRTCLCFEHPTRYIRYNYSMGEDVVHEDSITERHRAIVPHLNLTPEQRLHLVDLRAAYLVKSAMVQRQRDAAVQLLTSTLPVADFMSQEGWRYLRCAEAVEGLHRHLCGTFTYELAVQISFFDSLTARQCAETAVRAWPQHVDVHAVLNAVAEEEGAPSAATILAEAESRAHGAPLQGLRGLQLKVI